jgi:hypothetical protein
LGNALGGGTEATGLAGVVGLAGLVVVLTILGCPGRGAGFPIVDFGNGTGTTFIPTPPLGISSEGVTFAEEAAFARGAFPFAGGAAPFAKGTLLALGKGIVLGSKNWL